MKIRIEPGHNSEKLGLAPRHLKTLPLSFSITIDME